MHEIKRPSVPVGSCTTLAEASRRLGLSNGAMKYHKRHAGHAFPTMVARFGASELYVYAELEAFHRSIMWAMGDRHVKELFGGGDEA